MKGQRDSHQVTSIPGSRPPEMSHHICDGDPRGPGRFPWQREPPNALTHLCLSHSSS